MLGRVLDEADAAAAAAAQEQQSQSRDSKPRTRKNDVKNKDGSSDIVLLQEPSQKQQSKKKKEKKREKKKRKNEENSPPAVASTRVRHSTEHETGAPIPAAPTSRHNIARPSQHYDYDDDSDIDVALMTRHRQKILQQQQKQPAPRAPSKDPAAQLLKEQQIKNESSSLLPTASTVVHISGSSSKKQSPKERRRRQQKQRETGKIEPSYGTVDSSAIVSDLDDEDDNDENEEEEEEGDEIHRCFSNSFQKCLSSFKSLLDSLWDDRDEEDDPGTKRSTFLSSVNDGVKQQQQRKNNVVNGDPRAQYSKSGANMSGTSEAVDSATFLFNRRRRRKQCIVTFWFVTLAFSYAGERCTFKMLVDQAGPFRLFSVEMVTAIHALLLALGLFSSILVHYWKHTNSRRDIKEQRRRELRESQQVFFSNNNNSNGHRISSISVNSSDDDDDDDDDSTVGGGATSIVDKGSPFWNNNHNHLPLGLPLVDVGLMALFDVFSLMLVFLTGMYVSPTLTVVLVQFLIPTMAMLMQCTHTNGCILVAWLNYTTTSSSSTNATASTGQSPDSLQSGAGGGMSNVRGNNGSQTIGGNKNNQDNNKATNNGSKQNSFQQMGGSRSNSTSPQQQQNEEQNINLLSQRPLPNCAGLTRNHVWGSLLIGIACLLVLLPSFYTISVDSDFFLYAHPFPLSVAYNSIVFLLASLPAAASQLYKEHVFLQYKQPVPMNRVNLLISVFEFLFVSLLSPLVFTLQGVGWSSSDDNNADAVFPWYTVYPSTEFSQNFQDGFLCFFRFLDKEDQLEKYPEEAQCDWVLALVVAHVLCIISVGVGVDRLVNSSYSLRNIETEISSGGSFRVRWKNGHNSNNRKSCGWMQFTTVHGGLGVGIVLAVGCMTIYNVHNSPTTFEFGPWVETLNLISLVLLLVGFEWYHRVELPELTFETEYPQLDNLYDEQED